MNNEKIPTPRYQPTPRRVSSAGQARSQRASNADRAQSRRPETRNAQSQRPQARSAQPRRTATQRSAPQGPKPKQKGFPLVAGAIAAVAIIAVVVGIGIPAIGGLFSSQDAAESKTVVSFVAVGDNLPDDYIGWYADRLAGDEDDGLYDYSPIFEPIVPYIQGADLAYINQETHLGGDDIGPQGYPSFNTTDAMATTVVDSGFDFVASASNHSYDWGQGALAHSVDLWEKMPVAFTGTALTEEQYDRIVTQERNGITFALLNYTYGVNAYSQDTLPAYAVNFIDDDRIRADVQRAHEVADVVLVSMHWGTELLTEADDEQQRLAQLLADLDVDVVLGSHPHVIGPMAWVENSSNPDHRTLVAYSLGNFLADHEAPLADNVLEGMLTCDFVRYEEGGPVTVENVRWIPLVCHSDEDRSSFAVYAVDDYPAEMAKQCRALSDIDDPISWLYEQTHSIVGEQWF